MTSVALLDPSTVCVPPSDVDGAQAPLASGRDIANPTSALANVKTTMVMGARCLALAQPLAGPALLAQRLDEIERLVKKGGDVWCVFDLDNTIFDTRGRTLHALHVFDRENGTSYSSGLDERSMQEDGRKTALALGLPADIVERIGTVWDREFWDPANLVYLCCQ